MGLDEKPDNKSWWLATGGVVGAVLASSCCIAPLALFLLGVSGAWISNLTALEPYQPLFIVITLGLVGSGFWVVYFKTKKSCAKDSYCAKPESVKLLKSLLWTSAGLIAVALVFPYAAPLLLN
ncbi:MAG: mercuric transporter MerT family protein [Motiliproteus sp.]|nr:mercuric transporter MerT family protein [Motiliproteus sp.]